jgi:hypothetical protein
MCSSTRPGGGSAADSISHYAPRVNLIVGIAVAALFAIGAIALGLKFFSSTVHEQEDEKGWD